LSRKRGDSKGPSRVGKWNMTGSAFTKKKNIKKIYPRKGTRDTVKRQVTKPLKNCFHTGEKNPDRCTEWGGRLRKGTCKVERESLRKIKRYAKVKTGKECKREGFEEESAGTSDGSGEILGFGQVKQKGFREKERR